MVNGKTASWESVMGEKALELARIFAQSDFPTVETRFIDKDTNDIATTPLSANRCIKVTIEYSDIPEKENE